MENALATRVDPRFLAVAVVLGFGVFFVAKPFVPMILAFALGSGVLSFIPQGTRMLVLAAMVGMATGNGAILLFATGVFQNPIITEFGWTRTEYFVAIQMAIPGTILMSPIIGTLLDRYGVRKVVIPSVVLLSATVGALYFLTPHLWYFYTVFALLPVLGAGTSSAAYARLITLWFFRKRGLALGAALAGMGLGGAVVSPLLQWIGGSFGWRIGFLSLAGALLVFTLPVVLIWIRDTPLAAGTGVDGEAAGGRAGAGGRPGTAAGRVARTAGREGGIVPAKTPLVYGPTARESVRSARFWLLLAIFLLLGFAVGGLMFQLFPILTSRGVSNADAATVTASMGLALIAGRTFAGYLMDKFFAPFVAIAFLLGPLSGTLLLAQGGAGTSALLSGVLIGLAAGAEVDVLAYLVSRYFGSRAYATNYSWLYAAWAAGSGMGPTLAARAYDTLGTYQPALYAYAVIFVAVCLLMSRLGSYPLWPGTAHSARNAPTSPAMLADSESRNP